MVLEEEQNCNETKQQKNYGCTHPKSDTNLQIKKTSAAKLNFLITCTCCSCQTYVEDLDLDDSLLLTMQCFCPLT